MSTELRGIERALCELLTLMMAEDAKPAATPIAAHVLNVSDLSGPLPTRAESDLGVLLRQPVWGACHMAVRKLGDRVFVLTGTTDGMREVADRVAGQDDRLYGRRLATLDHAWDGLGSGADMWWA